MGSAPRGRFTTESVPMLPGPTERTPDEAATGRTLRLVVVEDDEDYRTMLRVLLSRAPFGRRVEARFFDRVAEACDAFATQRVDVLLADFHLPDGTGVDVVGHAQLVSPQSQRIVLTGTPGEAIAAVSERARPHAIWDKRLRADELRARLEGVFAEMRART